MFYIPIIDSPVEYGAAGPRPFDLAVPPFSCLFWQLPEPRVHAPDSSTEKVVGPRSCGAKAGPWSTAPSTMRPFSSEFMTPTLIKHHPLLNFAQ